MDIDAWNAVWWDWIDRLTVAAGFGIVGFIQLFLLSQHTAELAPGAEEGLADAWMVFIGILVVYVAKPWLVYLWERRDDAVGKVALVLFLLAIASYEANVLLAVVG